MSVWEGLLLTYGKVGLVALVIFVAIGLLCRTVERRGRARAATMTQRED